MCVEYGRPKWPITMLNHTNKQTSLVQKNVCFFLILAPYARTTRYEEAFCLKEKNGLGRFAPSALPHYNNSDLCNRTALSTRYVISAVHCQYCCAAECSECLICCLNNIYTPPCEGISPLGYWQKVNQSPTQTKPYNTLPPFEPRDSWSSYGAVRAYSEVLL